MDLRDDASYVQQPVRIIDRKEQELRTKVIPLVKVQWGHHDENEASWETEESIRQKYPHLFDSGTFNFEDEIFFRRVDCNDLVFFFIITNIISIELSNNYNFYYFILIMCDVEKIKIHK